MDLARTLASVAVRRASRGFTFEDLARAAASEQGTIGLVADWLAHARSSGLVHEAGFDTGVEGLTGPRRYRLASRRDALGVDDVT